MNHIFKTSVYLLFFFSLLLVGCSSPTPEIVLDDEMISSYQTDEGDAPFELWAPVLTEKKNRFTYTLTNNTNQQQTFTYHEQDRIDYEIKNDEGVVVYEFSPLSLDETEKEEWRVGEQNTVVFSPALPDLPSGDYTIKVWRSPNEEHFGYAEQTFTVN